MSTVGLGLRFDFLEDVLELCRAGERIPNVDFFEVAPENFMRRGGYLPASLETVQAVYPILSHGLTMDFGGVDPLDGAYLRELRAFVARSKATFHSDHLCFSGAGGRVFHDLLPLPLFRATAQHVAERAMRARDAVGVPIALENISYYLIPGDREVDEAEMIAEILERADAKLLLDVNNVYVNSLNHGFDARAFIERLPLDRVVQIHVAGHEHRPEHDAIIDTHGADVVDPVFDLLSFTMERVGDVPVLLERDHAIPALDTLSDELGRVRAAADAGLARRA
ncbi:MAG: DUF692 domain-containing protein [Polyangiaceae bacterium]